MASQMLGVIDFTQFRAEDGSNTKRRVQGIYTPPTAAAGGYITGGDIVAASDFKLGQLDILHLEDGLTAANADYFCVYDYVNQKLLAFVGSTGVEVSSTTDISAVKIRFEAIGR